MHRALPHSPLSSAVSTQLVSRYTHECNVVLSPSNGRSSGERVRRVDSAVWLANTPCLTVVVVVLGVAFEITRWSHRQRSDACRSLPACLTTRQSAVHKTARVLARSLARTYARPHAPTLSSSFLSVSLIVVFLAKARARSRHSHRSASHPRFSDTRPGGNTFSIFSTHALSETRSTLWCLAGARQRALRSYQAVSTSPSSRP